MLSIQFDKEEQMIPVSQKLILFTEHSTNKIDERIYVISTVLFMNTVSFSSFYFVHPFNPEYYSLISMRNFHDEDPNNFHYVRRLLVNPTAEALLSVATQFYQSRFVYDVYIDNVKVINKSNHSFITAFEPYFPSVMEQ